MPASQPHAGLRTIRTVIRYEHARRDASGHAAFLQEYDDAIHVTPYRAIRRARIRSYRGWFRRQQPAFQAAWRLGDGDLCRHIIGLSLTAIG